MSEILNKKALVEIVTEKSEVIKKDATIVVETVFDEITRTLSEGGKVDIPGFGKFEISEHPARIGISPITREPLEIAVLKVPKFKATKASKEATKQ